MKNHLSLLVIPILLSCNSNSKSITKIYDYDDIDRTIVWSEIFSKEQESYSIYFYNKKCGHCLEIKELIIDYYFKEIEMLYFLETNEESIYGPKSDLVGISNIKDFYIFGTPFLINIYKSSIENYYAGSKQIVDYINYKIDSNYN